MLTGSLPPITNRETWDLAFELYDDDVGPTEYIDLTSAVVTLTVADDSGCAVLKASSTSNDVITFSNKGVVQVRFTPSQVGALCPRTYQVGIRVALNGITKELFLGSIAVLEGIDRQ
jgi:hypothetical protein